jgi:hypothetical protein
MVTCSTFRLYDIVVELDSIQDKKNSLHGWRFKVGYGQQIIWRREGGSIVDFTHFARNLKKQRHNFLPMPLLNWYTT